MITAEGIEATLAKIKIFLGIDNGGVELVRIRDDGIVEVRLTGSCANCPMSLMTIRAGIERAIMIDHPEVKRVEQVK